MYYDYLDNMKQLEPNFPPGQEGQCRLAGTGWSIGALVFRPPHPDKSGLPLLEKEGRFVRIQLSGFF